MPYQINYQVSRTDQTEIVTRLMEKIIINESLINHIQYIKVNNSVVSVSNSDGIIIIFCILALLDGCIQWENTAQTWVVHKLYTLANYVWFLCTILETAGK